MNLKQNKIRKDPKFMTNEELDDYLFHLKKTSLCDNVNYNKTTNTMFSLINNTTTELDYTDPKAKDICSLIELIETTGLNKVGFPTKLGEYLHLITVVVEEEYCHKGVLTDFLQFIIDEHPKIKSYNKIVCEPTNDYTVKALLKANFKDVFSIKYCDLPNYNPEFILFKDIRKNFESKTGKDIAKEIGFYVYDRLDNNKI